MSLVKRLHFDNLEVNCHQEKIDGQSSPPRYVHHLFEYTSQRMCCVPFCRPTKNSLLNHEPVWYFAKQQRMDIFGLKQKNRLTNK